MQEGTIDIATGYSANSKKWKNTRITWADFIEKLKNSVQTNETLKEYLRASKTDQGKIKDVGGYVGGYLVGGRRNIDTVGHRQLLTLDVDFATSDFFFDFEMSYGCAAFLHATHKHSPTEPRYRLIIPLDREVSCDEYSAISRKVAGELDIEIFDPTTFDVNRLMFWPSNPKDVEYYWVQQQGDFLCADDVLASYADWKDSTLWPTSGKIVKAIGDAANKQEDPAFKKGVVGAFCRTYGIEEAIEKFLPSIYEAHGDRYTFTGGSTAGGLMVYENIWAYSHHGTDPASNRLCNSFDLVRVHLYGHLDQDSKETQSFKRMEELCTEDREVKFTIAKEKLGESISGEEDIDWVTELDVDAKGNYLSTSKNVDLILQRDSNLSGLFRYNLFDSKRYITRSAPWRQVFELEPMRNVDYAGVRNYMETTYGICSANKVEDSLTLEIERHAVHPIRDYLGRLQWDGQDRISTALTEYFGAEDTTFTSEAFRKMMTASVARVVEPGIKFDYMLVFVGSQGLKKSTFLDKLGHGVWFSDSFNTFQGTTAFEQLQGAWIIEIAELSAFKKSEVEAIKQFVTKRKDDYRPAYGRATETFKRQCVFYGTTNNMEFLKDPTGNRRFWPILCEQRPILKDVSRDLPLEVDQLWAQAVHLYHTGEKLYLTKEIEEQAKLVQEMHSEKDERVGMILEYLDRLLPENWDSTDLYDRRSWLDNPANEGTVLRDAVCTAEVWCECLGKSKEDMTRYNTRDVNDILRSLKDWEANVSTNNFRIYGKQKYYERKLY